MTVGPIHPVKIRRAREAEADEVIALLDEALLSFDRTAIRRGIESVLLAREDGHLRGALLLHGNHIAAIAVRPNHRRRGIGSALVTGAAADRSILTASCDREHRSFYASLGFEIETLANDRLFGRRYDISE